MQNLIIFVVLLCCGVTGVVVINAVYGVCLLPDPPSLLLLPIKRPYTGQFPHLGCVAVEVMRKKSLLPEEAVSVTHLVPVSGASVIRGTSLQHP